METIYKITFDNYKHETFIELYHNKEDAYNRFNAICEKAKNKKGYYVEDEGDLIICSFLSSSFDDYETTIVLTDCTLESLFCD